MVLKLSAIVRTMRRLLVMATMIRALTTGKTGKPTIMPVMRTTGGTMTMDRETTRVNTQQHHPKSSSALMTWPHTTEKISTIRPCYTHHQTRILLGLLALDDH